MDKGFHLWVEEYLFNPNFLQRVISILFLPLTLLYVIIVSVKRQSATPLDFGIPIISIGNLVVGGSGKTPFAIFLAKKQNNVCIILRGYGRESSGLFVVSKHGHILEDISVSGDEAMLMAKALPKATIIVSENRVEGIKKAKELNCKLIILDDGFSKSNIKKFDILLRPKVEPENIFCLPSGGYREPKMLYSIANMVLKEGDDFQRVVNYKKNSETLSILPNKLILLTAISKPKRVLDFLPKDTILKSFPDHYNFTKEDIDELMKSYKGYEIITTSKDLVKLEKFNLGNLYLMDMELKLTNSSICDKIDKYINDYSIQKEKNGIFYS